MTTSTALNEARRTSELAALADGGTIDVVVIGGGITGVGIALDAATRGLTVALVEKHDLAFIELWKKQKRRKLGFRFGYVDANKQAHVVVTRPKGT